MDADRHAELENSILSSASWLIKAIYWDIEHLYSRFDVFLQSVPKFLSTKWNSRTQMSNSFEARLQVPVRNSEIKMMNIKDINLIICRLGVECAMEDAEYENYSKLFGEDDFLALFQEDEPSLDEIKETFDFFDANKDGFIDCSDLQSVLSGMGFEEGCVLEDCKRMIRDFDVNGDGLIDFLIFWVLFVVDAPMALDSLAAALKLKACGYFGTGLRSSNILPMCTTRSGANLIVKPLVVEAKANTRADSAKILNRRRRKKFNGTAIKPRLSVFCSNKQLYAMLVDDQNKKCLFYGSTLQKSIRGNTPCTTIEAAERVGEELIQACVDLNINEISTYDRNGLARGERMEAFEIAIAHHGFMPR